MFLKQNKALVWFLMHNYLLNTLMWGALFYLPPTYKQYIMMEIFQQIRVILFKCHGLFLELLVEI